jgi:hypothetical protein
MCKTFLEKFINTLNTSYVNKNISGDRIGSNTNFEVLSFVYKLVSWSDILNYFVCTEK